MITKIEGFVSDRVCSVKEFYKYDLNDLNLLKFGQSLKVPITGINEIDFRSLVYYYGNKFNKTFKYVRNEEIYCYEIFEIEENKNKRMKKELSHLIETSKRMQYYRLFNEITEGKSLVFKFSNINEEIFVTEFRRFKNKTEKDVDICKHEDYGVFEVACFGKKELTFFEYSERMKAKRLESEKEKLNG